MFKLPTFSRRHALASLAWAAMPLSGFAQNPSVRSPVLPVWISNGNFPLMQSRIGQMKSGNGQVAVAGSMKLAGFIGGALLAPVLRLNQAEHALRDSPALKDVFLDKDFHSGLGQEVRAGEDSYTLIHAGSEGAAQVRIIPSATLRLLDADSVRLTVVCLVEVEIPGLRKFEWSCDCETSAVLKIAGPGGLNDPVQPALHAAVQQQVPGVLLAIASEISLRQRKLWRDPADPDRLVQINLLDWPPEVVWSYVLVAETPTQLMLAQANKSLGHLFARRYVFDKSLVRTMQRPPA